MGNCIVVGPATHHMMPHINSLISSHSDTISSLFEHWVHPDHQNNQKQIMVEHDQKQANIVRWKMFQCHSRTNLEERIVQNSIKLALIIKTSDVYEFIWILKEKVIY